MTIWLTPDSCNVNYVDLLYVLGVWLFGFLAFWGSFESFIFSEMLRGTSTPILLEVVNIWKRKSPMLIRSLLSVVLTFSLGTFSLWWNFFTTNSPLG